MTEWQTVPKTLTDEMIETARRIADGPDVSFQEHWDAMLASSFSPEGMVLVPVGAIKDILDAHDVLISTDRVGGSFKRHMEEPLYTLRKLFTTSSAR